MKIRSALILGDIHFDAEHKNLLKTAFDIAKSESVEHIYYLGDLLDAYALSSHDKHPDIKTSFLYEVDYAKDHFDTIRKMFPKAKISIIFGNHSDRVYRYLIKFAPELYHFVKIHEMLELKKFKISHFDYHWKQGVQILNTDLIARHKPYSNGMNHSINSIKKGLHSIVYGHLHTYSYSVHVTRKGNILRSFCNMCLVDINNPKFSYVENFPNWIQGFSLIHSDANGNWFDEKAMVINKKLWFRNKVYII